MTFNAAGIDEYLFTIGILVAFIGTIASVALGRRQIRAVLKGSGIKWMHVLAAAAIVAVFLGAELAIVKPTQLLFFDDVIYQAGAVSLLHSGQAWMCNYGSPTACFSGQIFHEPIGTAFLLAIGFGIFGVHLAVAYHTLFAITAVAVFMAFLVGAVLLKDPVAGLFSGLILGLTPVVLTWAMPTTSDMPMLAFGLISIFFMLVFLRKKSLWTFAALLLSAALVSYMKVDALLYLPVLLIMFIVLDTGNLRKDIKMLKRNLLEPLFLVVILLFAVSVLPEAVYTYAQLTTGNYGVSQSSYLSFSCILTGPAIITNQTLGFKNIEANFCPDVMFWTNAYKSSDVMQPLIYTLFAVLGGIAMAFRKRREVIAVVLWFGAFFMMYTSFYAGSVLFGVDWRFMLEMVAPTSILGGYFASLSFTKGIKIRRKGALSFLRSKVVLAIAYAVVLVAIFYPLYAMAPLLGVKPANVIQAPDARFYEGFVYNSISAVPSSCLIFSYDPTLMIINGRTSAQIGYLNGQSYSTYKSEYSCLVVDWGYWCYTPNNYCTTINQTFTLKSIVNSTFTEENKTYGFYYVTGLKNGSS